MSIFSVFFTNRTIETKNIQNEQNEQNSRCAIQRNTVLCIFLSPRKCPQKNSQNTSKKQKVAKHPQNEIFKTLQNTVF